MDQISFALARMADRHSDNVAILDDKVAVTFEELYLRAGGFAKAIDQETDPKATVALCLPRELTSMRRFWVACFARRDR